MMRSGVGSNYADKNINKSKNEMKWKEKEAVDSAFQKAMLGTLPPTNWSQTSVTSATCVLQPS